MKTIKLLTILLSLFLVMSCDTYHQVITHVNRDGSIERTVFARGDSAFMAGNNAGNPFQFDLTDQWTVTRYDSVINRTFWGKDMKFNVSVHGKFTSPEEYTRLTQAKEEYKQLVLPTEKLQKKFRWFYTYYTYNAVYNNLSARLPIPMDLYLTKEEQLMYFQSNLSAFEGRNGLEQHAVLDDITDKCEQWYERSVFQITFDAVAEILLESGETEYNSRLQNLGDTLFIMAKPKLDKADASSNLITAVLDQYFSTNYFTTFLLANGTAVEDRIEQKSKLLSLFENSLSFSLEMPGSITQANTQLRDGNMLVWKVDAFRFLTDDYSLQAQSRVLNVWTVVLTLLLLVIGIGLVLKRKDKTDHPEHH